MNNLYSILNLEGYANDIRNAAAKSISENYSESLDDYISINQVYNIVNENAVDMDEDGRYILDEDANETIFDSVRIWIHNVGLAKLAADNLIECAWDDKLNEMVFWASNKKEPKVNDKPRKNKRPKRKNP